jgi:hypothetical protein
MPNVRGTVKTPVKQLPRSSSPRPLPGDCILSGVRANASSATVSQDGRCEAKIAMPGSACISTAETGADTAVVLTQGVEKPRARDKTVRVTAEAYDVATTRAREAETDRKTVVSEAILKDDASPEEAVELQQAKAKVYKLTAVLAERYTEAALAGTLERGVIREFAVLIHELPGLAAVSAKGDTIENLTSGWRDDEKDAEECAGK